MKKDVLHSAYDFMEVKSAFRTRTFSCICRRSIVYQSFGKTLGRLPALVETNRAGSERKWYTTFELT